MSELLTNLLSSGQFIPHGHCYLWEPNLVWLHVISDGLIALAYYSIPTALFYFVHKRVDLPFYWIFLLFSAFIIACGTTHILEIWTLWYPTYWLSGLIKAVTAMLSFITAVELLPLIPEALALPSPSQLRIANQALKTQIAERLLIEKELRKYQNSLEELVNIRTNELTQVNEQLRQEISERQSILEILRHSEERYRYLAEAIPQLVWTTDAQGKCDFVNNNWLNYTGMKSEQTLGFGWMVALHPDDIEITRKLWGEAVKTGQLFEIEYRFKRADDNSYRWLLARALPLKDQGGCVVKWFGTCTDVHEQKQILQERAQLLELEQNARAKAETANRMKDEFMAVLSHELRTPLNAILGWAQLLQSHRFDQAQIDHALVTIERNAKLQVQLIEDLLDVSRILQGKLSLKITNINLELVILAALESIRLAAEAKSIQVTSILVPNLRKILGDPIRLQQVVWNLLSNAVKFTPKGGKVEVSLEQSNGYAEIQVKDTGKGISPEFLPYVFDYFRQADSSSTRKFGGLGLGLAIVRNIVETHGGSVEAQSNGEDQGSTFTVRLPLVEDQSFNIVDEGNQPSSLVSNSLPLTGVQVLVVEDDPDSRNFVTFVLEQDGAEVIAVESAFEALQTLTKVRLDLLVSDISMPNMDGYMLLRQIRNWTPEQGGQIRAIALTAYAGYYDRQKALEAGFQMHIAKPLNPQELVTAVINVLAT
jgi:PAS domain S-box-containing protein